RGRRDRVPRGGAPRGRVDHLGWRPGSNRDEDQRRRDRAVLDLGAAVRGRRRPAPGRRHRWRLSRQARAAVHGSTRMIRVIIGSTLTAVFIIALGTIGLAAGGSRSLNAYLTLAGILFTIGMFGFLARR